MAHSYVVVINPRMGMGCSTFTMHTSEEAARKKAVDEAQRGHKAAVYQRLAMYEPSHKVTEEAEAL